MRTSFHHQSEAQHSQVFRCLQNVAANHADYPIFTSDNLSRPGSSAPRILPSYWHQVSTEFRNSSLRGITMPNLLFIAL
jgi:hypothetical protein